MDVCESVRVQKSEDVSKTCADVGQPMTVMTQLSKAEDKDIGYGRALFFLSQIRRRLKQIVS